MDWKLQIVYLICHTLSKKPSANRSLFFLVIFDLGEFSWKSGFVTHVGSRWHYAWFQKKGNGSIPRELPDSWKDWWKDGRRNWPKLIEFFQPQPMIQRKIFVNIKQFASWKGHRNTCFICFLKRIKYISALAMNELQHINLFQDDSYFPRFSYFSIIFFVNRKK